jgi:hypothetical protein
LPIGRFGRLHRADLPVQRAAAALLSFIEPIRYFAGKVANLFRGLLALMPPNPDARTMPHGNLGVLSEIRCLDDENSTNPKTTAMKDGYCVGRERD